MGLFDFLTSKDKREKHNLMDVIEYTGPNNVLVWKHGCENFNTNSQLIVSESQVAVFFKDGVALESFPAGRYTLDTQNYPFLRNLVRGVTGGKSPFNCSVYFLNKAISMGLSWGTDSPIRMNDPIYHLPTNITAYGDFSVFVADEKRLLCELVGTTQSYTQEDVSKYFSGLIATKVRSLITGVLSQNNLSLLGIDAHLDSISQMLLPQVQSVFAEHGIGVNHFVVAHIGYTGLEKIEQELHDQTRQNIQFSGQMQRDTTKRNFNIETQRMEGLATAEVNRELGLSELQKKMIEVAGVQAANVGPIMSGNTLGIGMPVVPAEGLTGNQVLYPGAAATDSLRVIADLSTNNPPQPASTTPQPLTPPSVMPGVMPDKMAAAERPKQEQSFEERIKRLKLMHDNDLLTKEEFLQQKQLLLQQIMNGGE